MPGEHISPDGRSYGTSLSDTSVTLDLTMSPGGYPQEMCVFVHRERQEQGPEPTMHDVDLCPVPWGVVDLHQQTDS